MDLATPVYMYSIKLCIVDSLATLFLTVYFMHFTMGHEPFCVSLDKACIVSLVMVGTGEQPVILCRFTGVELGENREVKRLKCLGIRIV